MSNITCNKLTCDVIEAASGRVPSQLNYRTGNASLISSVYSASGIISSLSSTNITTLFVDAFVIQVYGDTLQINFRVAFVPTSLALCEALIRVEPNLALVPGFVTFNADISGMEVQAGAVSGAPALLRNTAAESVDRRTWKFVTTPAAGAGDFHFFTGSIYYSVA